jgi:hypothetical protein
MAKVTIVYWRDIPAQVIVKAGRQVAKRQLPERFEKAIDMAAMRADLRDTDSYLSEWRRESAEDCGEDLEQEAEALANKLDQDYPQDRLVSLAKSGGLEQA